MIITKINGGLGNQMFCYAAGRRLVYVLGVKLKMDISGYENCKLRTYSLCVFNIEENFATSKEVKALTVRKKDIVDSLASRVLRKSQKPASSYIREKYFHFDPSILSLPDGVYLDGFWQSEKYFDKISSMIRKDFTFKEPQTGLNKELGEKIAYNESISIHIRRSDYVTEPLNYHIGTCDLSYYYRSVEYISRQINSPHFFVFSDDPQWVQKNFKISYPVTVISHNGTDRGYEDLRLMISCKHHIIANSTFSWWGAWLCTNPEKIVIAPKQWFRFPKRRIYDSSDLNDCDLIPETWYRK